MADDFLASQDGFTPAVAPPAAPPGLAALVDGAGRLYTSPTEHGLEASFAAAFRRHGYPWHAHDPYADLFRRWVPDSGHLPPPVDAVLAARGTALRKKARTEARELRDAVEKLGFVVRDEGDRQFWRPLVRP